MFKQVNGNEAAAWAALAAGVDYFSHYPGSPVNLVAPALKQLSKTYEVEIKFNDALNEHIAALAAAGASYCGARSMVVMKHVGMNIAADPFNYIGYTGVKGGMVVIVGTDPGANSSTGEEDVHWYIPQVNFPLFEPTTIREVYHQVREAFELSETYDIPVIVFIPTRLAHNSDLIPLPRPETMGKKRKNFHFEKNPGKYINVGQRTVKNHRLLLERIERLSIEKEYTKTFFNAEAPVGLITRGLTLGHTFESVGKLGLSRKVQLLNIDLVYPVPANTIKKFVKGKEEIIIIEDQDGFLENQIKMNFFNEIKCSVYGKEFFPRYGEIQFHQVFQFLAEKFNIPMEEKPRVLKKVPERLGTNCEGCPHRGSYFAIDRVLEGTDGIIGGDIGCSSLPPFRADWLLCMNAGIGVSQGMAHILEDRQVVISTGGDGSFFHTGLLSLQSACENRIDLVHVVFDNRLIAMTGHQDSPTTRNNHFDYRKMLEAIGVDQIVEVSAFHPWKFARVLREQIKKKGVRVVWVKGNCVYMPSEFTRLMRSTRELCIKNEKCGSCNMCYDQLGCPAINRIEKEKRDLWIDPNRCSRCGECRNLCPNGAIKSSFYIPLTRVAREGMKFLKESLFRRKRA